MSRLYWYHSCPSGDHGVTATPKIIFKNCGTVTISQKNHCATLYCCTRQLWMSWHKSTEPYQFTLIWHMEKLIKISSNRETKLTMKMPWKISIMRLNSFFWIPIILGWINLISDLSISAEPLNFYTGEINSSTSSTFYDQLLSGNDLFETVYGTFNRKVFITVHFWGSITTSGPKHLVLQWR